MQDLWGECERAAHMSFMRGVDSEKLLSLSKVKIDVANIII